MPRKLFQKAFRKMVGFVRPRSHGIVVSRGVKRRLRAAAAAQRAGDWVTAAEAYRVALARAPTLTPIWVQYGHVLREAGRPGEAGDAYREAVALSPQGIEPHRYLIGLARAAGDRAGLFRHALAGYRIDPGDPVARTLLLQALDHGEADHAAPLTEMAALIGVPVSTVTPPTTKVALHIDVGDLIAHFARSRLPSGLQRVEIEVARAAFVDAPPDLALCCWSIAAAAWKPLSASAFLALCDAAAGDVDETGWRHRLDALLLGLAVAPQIDFAAGSTLFQLGMAWGDALYHPAVARAKANGLRFAAIACDVIPLVRPDEVPADIVGACAQWLNALAEQADAIIAISAATRDEMAAVSAKRGRPIAKGRIGVVPLDATFQRGGGSGGSGGLADLGLSPGGFALYVSTIEPRKNHLNALATWRQLIDAKPDNVPDLVCVGRRGWRSEAVTAVLAADPVLRAKVRLLDAVTDEALDRLYDGCAFLFYPSLQEGWGLPITEALARGKVPVIGRNSSLPEAGGRFAVYVDPGSPVDMAAAIEKLIADRLLLAERQEEIRREFHPRPWSQIAEDMLAFATGARRWSFAPPRSDRREPQPDSAV